MPFFWIFEICCVVYCCSVAWFLCFFQKNLYLPLWQILLFDTCILVNIFLCRGGCFTVASYSAGGQREPGCMLRRVWWLITLWLCVSRACQLLWPHEVREHLGMSGDVGGWPRPIRLPGTATRRAASISRHPPPLLLTSGLPVDPAWTKGVHSYYMTHNTLRNCEQRKAMSWGCTSVTITTGAGNMPVGELSRRTTTCWVWE